MTSSVNRVQRYIVSENIHLTNFKRCLHRGTENGSMDGDVKEVTKAGMEEVASAGMTDER